MVLPHLAMCIRPTFQTHTGSSKPHSQDGVGPFHWQSLDATCKKPLISLSTITTKKWND